MARKFMKGAEAIAEAAVRSGCRFFAGYPITPQNEIPEYFARRMPEVGGVFVQGESEVASVNMVYGAAASGVRAMTSTSGPGFSLKQEGISYMCGAQLPAVIVDVMRAGPNLGTIGPSQSDYFQATRGGGHGDYRTVVLAPCSIQETVDLMQEAFDIADQYRNPVILLADGMIGQMMEPIEWHDIPKRELPEKTWATDGHDNKVSHRTISAVFGDNYVCEEVLNKPLAAKYRLIAANEVRYEEKDTADAEVVLVAYGTMSRVSERACEILREQGVRAGLFRPIVLWPYPEARLHELAAQEQTKCFLSVEMSDGQMIDDVRISVAGQKPVSFVGRNGGVVPTPDEIVDAVKKALAEVKA